MGKTSFIEKLIIKKHEKNKTTFVFSNLKTLVYGNVDFKIVITSSNYSPYFYVLIDGKWKRIANYIVDYETELSIFYFWAINEMYI